MAPRTATKAPGHPDILSPRLILRLMTGDIVNACLAPDLPRAEALLGAHIPPELLDHAASLHWAKTRLDEDPAYQPWSARALIFPAIQTMIGHLRFHARPDAPDLHPYARNAVEFGYTVLPAHRRHGYATEAAAAAMRWATATAGVTAFILTIAPHNTPSLALATRLGFRRVGRQIDEIDGIEAVYLREAPALPRLVSLPS